MSKGVSVESRSGNARRLAKKSRRFESAPRGKQLRAADGDTPASYGRRTPPRGYEGEVKVVAPEPVASAAEPTEGDLTGFHHHDDDEVLPEGDAGEGGPSNLINDLLTIGAALDPTDIASRIVPDDSK